MAELFSVFEQLSTPAIKPIKKLSKNSTELDGKTWLQYSISVWNDIRKTPDELALRRKFLIRIHKKLSAIHSLLCKGFIKQNSGDRVKWDHDDATFYTEPSKRAEIDGLIRQ